MVRNGPPPMIRRVRTMREEERRGKKGKPGKKGKRVKSGESGRLRYKSSDFRFVKHAVEADAVVSAQAVADG